MPIKINKNTFWIFLMMILTVSSCQKKNYASREEYQFSSANGKPDYSDLHYWAAHPWKWDPSDSIPRPLRKIFRKDSVADVFFLYPTTLTKKEDTRWNAPLDDVKINVKTDYSAILYQASTFNERCRVFAPRYRQAHIEAFYTNDKKTALDAFELAYTDIKEAFEYYLKNYNSGRPIIIAAHSQGTVHAARLLKEYFEGKPLGKQLVCAYLIGMPVADNYFTSLKPCSDSTSTGCFVSWRTFKKGYVEQTYVAKEDFKSIVVNPLTWTMGSEHASRKLNRGGVLKNFNKIKPGVVDAQIHQNILWTIKPRFFGNIFLSKKNYHIGDINLFYRNIRDNVQTRIQAFNNGTTNHTAY